MIRFITCYIIVILVIGYATTTAWADLDYRCLKNCVDGGGKESVCMPQCTYISQPDKTHQPVKKSAHDEFSPLAASNGRIMLPPRSPDQSPSSMSYQTSYKCQQQCLQNGLEYKLCEQQCSPKIPGTTNIPKQ